MKMTSSRLDAAGVSRTLKTSSTLRRYFQLTENLKKNMKNERFLAAPPLTPSVNDK
jgi:hypothetical protein